MAFHSITGSPTPHMPKSQTGLDWIAVTALALTLIGWAFTATSSYSADTNALMQRLTAVEEKTHAADQRLERMENKIDRLLERLP